MPCYRPINAWRTTGTTRHGKKPIVFKKSANATTPLQVPCGQCIGCKLERSLMWAIRCVHESQLHDQNSFITLTYSPEFLPWDGSLQKKHFQDFMKRLRRSYKTNPIKYYMCGEYGEKLTRPHFHACLFGIDFPDKEVWKEEEGLITYTSDILSERWGKGFVTISDVTFDSAAYVARYVTKKVTGDKAQDHYLTTNAHTGELISLEPEYTTMSNGIGKRWLEKYTSDVYPSDFLVHQGKIIKTPRYYDNLYDIPDTIKLARKERGKKHAKDNTPERLAVREKVKLLKFKQLTRSYEHHDT
ncbi:replication initiator protein [Microviridae sp.]|nr:replication initiator protein [Microviridae sp.]